MLIVNPFSQEAERIVKKYHGKEMSHEVFAHARRLVDWKTSAKKRGSIPPALLSGYDVEKDILAQRLLFLTVALNFTPYSNELRLVKESIQALVKARLNKLDLIDETNVVNHLSDLFDIHSGSPTVDGGMRFGEVFVEKQELFALGGEFRKYGEPWAIKYAVRWRELVPIIKGRELRFIDLYLVKGLALLSIKDLIDYYSILVALRVEDYIKERFDKFQTKKKDTDVGGLVAQTSEIEGFLSSVAGESFTGSILSGKSAKLRRENFPPCIKGILAGVQTGSRNYAISVLLTSFLSYARAAPKKVINPKISDYIKDPKVLTDEILPLVYEAATRCSPPLFQDQPGEKMNVLYHLGLGLKSEAKLENAGSSNWYFPPNCEKIRRESPGLCRPDETCKQIKNPLTYYFVRFKKADNTSSEEG